MLPLCLCIASFLSVTCGKIFTNDPSDVNGRASDQEVIVNIQKRLAAIEAQQTVYVDRISNLEKQQQKDNAHILTLQDQLNEAQNLIMQFSLHDTQMKHPEKIQQSRKLQYPYVVKPLEKEDSPHENWTLDIFSMSLDNPSYKEERDRIPNESGTSSIPVSRAAESSVIAFHAYLSHDYDKAARNMEIRFDSITTNVGNGYSGNTGTFTCPSSGVYMFAWTVHIESHFMSTELIHNGGRVSGGYSGDTSFSSTGTNTAVVELIQGDEVWIRVRDFNDLSEAGHIVAYWDATTFSGFRIQ